MRSVAELGSAGWIRRGERAPLREHLEKRAKKMRRIESGEQITTDEDFGRFYSRVDRDCFVGEFLDFVVRSSTATSARCSTT